VSDQVRQHKITPETVTGYTLTHKLGQGSTGTVFKAKKIATGEPFAIKLIFPALTKHAGFQAKFVQLAELASRLNHSSIVRTYEAGTSNDFHFVVMEFVEGKTLETVVSRGAMDEQRALQIAHSIARALVHAQQLGLLHRDVKPANILLPRGGDAKLADLGLAVMATNPQMAGGVTGTPHYISPEAARSDPAIDIRADVYSLGATLHHMLTGQRCFPDRACRGGCGPSDGEGETAGEGEAGRFGPGVAACGAHDGEEGGRRPWPKDVVGLLDAILRGDKPFESASLRRPGVAPAASPGSGMPAAAPAPPPVPAAPPVPSGAAAADARKNKDAITRVMLPPEIPSILHQDPPGRRIRRKRRSRLPSILRRSRRPLPCLRVRVRRATPIRRPTRPPRRCRSSRGRRIRRGIRLRRTRRSRHSRPRRSLRLRRRNPPIRKSRSRSVMWVAGGAI